MSYDNSNSGSLNFSDDKRSDRSPDFWGSLQLSGEVLEALNQGKRIRLTGWKRDGRNGQFISLKAEVARDPQKQVRDRIGGDYDMKAAEALAKTSAAENRQEALTADFDDDIPF